jgi:Domain of unknown function (DUF4157)
MRTHESHTRETKNPIENNAAANVSPKQAVALRDNRQNIIERGELKGAFLTDNRKKTVQSNTTGMPDQLKTAVEGLSGISLDDVRVHYGSAKPAQMQAKAFAQGNQIHLGPGQETHLPHEAWHVVQQKQGRVRPTIQLKGGAAVNDDTALEKEATVMGAQALQLKTQTCLPCSYQNVVHHNVVQRQTDIIQLYQPSRPEIGRNFQVRSGAWTVATLENIDETGYIFLTREGMTLTIRQADHENIRPTWGWKSPGTHRSGDSEATSSTGVSGGSMMQGLSTPSLTLTPFASSHEGTHDDRQFISSLDMTFRGKLIEGDKPLETHRQLREGLGTGKKRGSENQVNASIGVILNNSLGQQRIVRIRIPETFTSGEGTMDISALTRFMVANGVIESSSAYRAENHAHSEQELTLYLIANVNQLAEQLAAAVGGTGEDIVGVMLDLVSIPNTVCNPCHQSLEALFASGSQWIREFLAALSFSGIFVGPRVRSVIRASAEEVFTGAKTQYEEARKHKQIKTGVDVTQDGNKAAFLEHVSNLEGQKETHTGLVETIKKRAAGELGDKRLELGVDFDLRARIGFRLTEDMVGIRFEVAGRRFEVIRIIGGLRLRFAGVSIPSNLHQLVRDAYGEVRRIGGERMSCYIRSVVTGMQARGLLGGGDVNGMVETVEDHLEYLGLRFVGETIDAGGLAAVVVRQTLHELIPTHPDIGIRIVQWNPNTGALTDFVASAGGTMITLLYTPGHFDLIP